MHIGIVTACYHPVVNGVTRMVAQYERHLAADGHQVTIFTLGKPAPGEDPAKVLRSPAVPVGQTGYYFAPRYSRQAQLKLRDVDVVHCHHLLMGLEFAGRYSQSPVVFTNHTRYDLYLSAFTHMPDNMATLIMRSAWRRLSGLADVIIAPSASVRALLIGAGVRTPVEIIENGIDTQRFRNPVPVLSRAAIGLPAAAIIFTYVGRLSPEKNLRRLVSEFCQAARRAEDIHLLLVGSGPSLGALEKQILVSGLAERIHLVGQVTPEQVPSYLAISDAFASASLSEVHPLTVIEALAANLPVVAIDSPGINEVVTHGQSGLLVQDAVGDLAGAIAMLAEDSSMRERLSAGATASGMSYDFQKTAQRTLSLYRRLLRGRAGQDIGANERSGARAGSQTPIMNRFLRRDSFDGSYGDGNNGR